MKMRCVVFALSGVVLLAGCASGPITTWPYSSWYSESGADSMGGFKARRDGCLAQVGANLQPARVPKGRGQEQGEERFRGGSLHRQAAWAGRIAGLRGFHAVFSFKR